MQKIKKPLESFPSKVPAKDGVGILFSILFIGYDSHVTPFSYLVFILEQVI